MSINNMSPEQRLTALIKECVAKQQVWILTDNDGCVMLNSEDEDCAPVWPNEEAAKEWATGEWADCEPKAIELKLWHTRWTQGLEGDEVAIAVYPDANDGGLVVSPQDFDFELRTQAKRVN